MSDLALFSQARLDTPDASTVMCAGHGGSILLSVAVRITVDRHAAYACRQAACIAAVAQDLAARGCELL